MFPKNTAIRVITIIIIVILLMLYLYKWYQYHKNQKIHTWPPNGPSRCPDYFSYNPSTTKCLNPFKLGSNFSSTNNTVDPTTEETAQNNICTTHHLTWEGACQ